MNEVIWETKMFELAEEKNLSLREIAKRGNYKYHVSYLSHIKTGRRNVPDSLDFQNWVARILGVPREEIFFARPCTEVQEQDVST